MSSFLCISPSYYQPSILILITSYNHYFYMYQWWKTRSHLLYFNEVIYKLLQTLLYAFYTLLNDFRNEDTPEQLNSTKVLFVAQFLLFSQHTNTIRTITILNIIYSIYGNVSKKRLFCVSIFTSWHNYLLLNLPGILTVID